jgi:RNA 3'-terminal phosphate cyclase
MSVSIRIDYISDSKVTQAASFPLRGRRPERVALDWWKQLKKETSYRAVLQKVTADMVDITDLVKELEEREYQEKNKAVDDLPF